MKQLKPEYPKSCNNMDSTFIWNAITLKGEPGDGIIRGPSKKSAWAQLHNQGYYQIKLEGVAREYLAEPLRNAQLIYILESLASILDAGISMREALDLLISDRRWVITRYVFLELKRSLHEGQSLEKGFLALTPLFPEFFIAMIRLCEKSGKLNQGLNDLKTYYQHQENRRQELERIFRYPKIVGGMILILSLGVIVFVVPMFNSVYALFGEDLPFLTGQIVQLSRFFHQNDFPIFICTVCFVLWSAVPGLRTFHPWLLITRRVRRVVQSREDPFLYAHAMALLLDSGQSVNQAAQQATVCMSRKNHHQGELLTQKLNTGVGFAEAFQEQTWFPLAFQRFITPAEKTGLLKTGFEQIYTYIDRQRSARFEKWSRFLEPALMLILGTVTLTLLLSIYLPVFDLGNRIG